jgi:hypothetical protein
MSPPLPAEDFRIWLQGGTTARHNSELSSVMACDQSDFSGTDEAVA